MKPILDAHIHSIASGHAYSTIAECARAAADIGLSVIAITDHAPGMPDTAIMPHFANLRCLPCDMFGVRLLRGVELNIMDYTGAVDMPAGQYSPLDVRIASLHTPCIQSGSIEDNTNALIGAMQNPLIQIIGHPGDPAYPIDVARVLDAAQETGTLLELNNVSLDPNTTTRKGGEATVRALAEGCLKRGLPVIMGSDAHVHTAVGALDSARQLLEALGFPSGLVVNTSEELFAKAMGIAL